MESSSSSLFSRTIGPWGEEGGAKKRRGGVALKSARKALTNFFHLLHSFYRSSSFLRTSSISIDIGAKEEEEGEEPFFGRRWVGPGKSLFLFSV